MREGRVTLIDVVGDKEIFRTKKLNSRKVQAAKRHLVADDPTDAVIQDLAEFVSEGLTLNDIPSKLNSELAAKRVIWLSGRKHMNPLRAMAEIQFYRQMDLIGLPELMTAYKTMLDQESALTLIGGSPADKSELLAPYLPKTDFRSS